MYSRNSKINSALRSSQRLSKKAEGTIYSGMVATDTVNKLFKLKQADKENRKVFDTVSKFAKSKGLNDLVMPSYAKFLQGESPNYKGIDIGIDSLYQMSFIGDPKLKELKKVFGITDTNETITELLKTMKVNNGKTK